jgi:broad specificity phosphatase PhoE
VLVLVRHAMPLTDPDTDPADWPLSPAGAAAARAVGHLIPTGVPGGAVLVASDEPKAYDTLTAATGRPVIPEPRLREVFRPREPFADDFAVAREAYLSGRPSAGWEPHPRVAARVDAAIAAHRVPDLPLVLAGHGMVFTVWLAAQGLLDDPVAFWRDLRFPDVLRVVNGHIARP